ncbi:RNA 2',3'-cyclic phosphodiesterase [Roseiconus lacunae]|uniref:RNA 2',3'-cyclic phosphodiesterase n=1 Tax=Roseiconus lacunae TaxID=2605694 RepID=A0ABT7PRF0_9BACT|nr:RNA 2',3'-cyclic phosphodiesterase [Roseiconus lacunae]MCD0458313.1 RNA 2',3'-cyclic phosphodiesterase [Roseiconus lacunae]MDM4019078.1 RNA 2',3'-cyclic phosphodiesterase [Roseiconus lacunae]
MQTIRSFISIPITPGITSAASKIIRALKPVDSGIKWVPIDNLHLTLKFLGEVDNVEIPDVCNAIRRVTQQIAPFELHFHGTGGFPNLEKPRVLYAGIEDPSGRLVQMVADMELELADLGFKPEPRDYRPHLTLGRARSKGGRVSAELTEAAESFRDTHLGDMVVDELNLMASFLDKQGPTYQVMDTIELNEDAES